MKGWDENEQPILEAKRQISLRFVSHIFLPTTVTFCSVESAAYEVLRLRDRMLLSHTNGLVHVFTSPTIQKYFKHKGEEYGFRELYASHLKDPLISLCKGVPPRCR